MFQKSVRGKATILTFSKKFSDSLRLKFYFSLKPRIYCNLTGDFRLDTDKRIPAFETVCIITMVFSCYGMPQGMNRIYTQKQ